MYLIQMVQNNVTLQKPKKKKKKKTTTTTTTTKEINKGDYKFFYKPLGALSLDFGSSMVGWVEVSSSTFISSKFV